MGIIALLPGASSPSVAAAAFVEGARLKAAACTDARQSDIATVWKKDVCLEHQSSPCWTICVLACSMLLARP